MKKGSADNDFIWFSINDLLLIDLGILLLAILLQISHYYITAASFGWETLRHLPIIYYFDVLVKSTSYKYLYFTTVPLLLVAIAKHFLKKHWNVKLLIAMALLALTVATAVFFVMPAPTKLENIPKAEQPTAQLFVMSFCPYGQLAEKNLIAAQESLSDSIMITPHFILKNESKQPDGCIPGQAICSLHGVAEAKEDIRQMCIWKYYPQSWLRYAVCIADKCDITDVEQCWLGCAVTNNIDADKIKDCADAEGLAMAKEELKLMDQYDAYSSPTFILNEVKYIGDKKDPDSLKAALCAAFVNAPAECDPLSSLSVGKWMILDSGQKPVKQACVAEGACPITGEMTDK